jgi:hypothetical protein
MPAIVYILDAKGSKTWFLVNEDLCPPPRSPMGEGLPTELLRVNYHGRH